jgi:hypothetical protein
VQGPPLEEEKDGGRRCVPEWKNNGCYSLDITGKRQLPVRTFTTAKTRMMMAVPGVHSTRLNC